MAAGTKRVQVGTIGRAVGLKGEVSVNPLRMTAAQWMTFKDVWLGEGPHAGSKHRIEHCRQLKRQVVTKFFEIETRTAAEALNGQRVFAEPKALAKAMPEKIFAGNIVGATAVDEEGRELGVVREVMQLPANDVWVIEKMGKEILVPAVPEFVKEVRTEQAKRTVVLKLIEGMLE